MLYFGSIWLSRKWYNGGRKHTHILSLAQMPHNDLIAVDTSRAQVRLRVIMFWFTSLLPPCIAWCVLIFLSLYQLVVIVKSRTARVSMGLSISRYIPLQNPRARWALFSLWILFGLMGLSIIFEEILVCGGHTSTSHGTVFVQCYLGQKLAIVIICSESFIVS